jgi:hypothetical protein
VNRYFQEVLDAHQLIRHWLGETSAQQAVYDILLGRFSPAYSMVTLSGRTLDFDGLNTFFHTQRGAKIGIEIEIDNMELVTESATGAVVTYQEHQQFSQPASDTSLLHSRF